MLYSLQSPILTTDGGVKNKQLAVTSNNSPNLVMIRHTTTTVCGGLKKRLVLNLGGYYTIAATKYCVDGVRSSNHFKRKERLQKPVARLAT